ncbi:MAG: MarR family transcriptional regulator, partial [Candidatus Altiarchaeota archaeon]
PKTENRELKTENGGLRTENRELKTENGGLRTENRELKTENGGLRTENRELKTENRESDTGILTDRQRDILRVIGEEGRPINQTLVCERLGLPKSSVSRNVDGLERMGLIKKTRNGMSTMLEMRGGG